ncbi:MAG: SIMPL domain-containing protein [Clostridia bacterium]|nr:SIMPL domain-containing protein [Clostridia bacterium]
MKRTITVKGVGTAKTKPDRVVLNMTVETKDREYENAIRSANEQIADLNAALEAVGYEKGSLKTMDFNVHMNYEDARDENGLYRSVFAGYMCFHSLKLEFDFTNAALGKTLSAIASCNAKPQFNLSFTVKNPASIKEKLLESAAMNARQKAEILCAASGVSLGELVNIDYNWGDVNVFSLTNFTRAKNESAVFGASFDAQLSPDDIRSTDSVTFTWEMERDENYR